MPPQPILSRWGTWLSVECLDRESVAI